MNDIIKKVLLIIFACFCLGVTLVIVHNVTRPTVIEPVQF